MSFNPTFGKVTTHDYNTFCILACQLLNLISFWRDETVAVPTTTSKGWPQTSVRLRIALDTMAGLAHFLKPLFNQLEDPEGNDSKLLRVTSKDCQQQWQNP